jgi:hypothetical protein
MYDGQDKILKNKLSLIVIEDKIKSNLDSEQESSGKVITK